MWGSLEKNARQEDSRKKGFEASSRGEQKKASGAGGKGEHRGNGTDLWDHKDGSDLARARENN